VNERSVAEVASRHGVALLLQFGSSVTGLTHPQSDVDFAVLLHQPQASLATQADLMADLQALVPERKVDVAFLDHADPLLLKQVCEHCELVFGSQRRLDELKMYAFTRYQDHRPYFEMERAYVDRVAAGARS
jgi:predicted nucleotidyltransferase